MSFTKLINKKYEWRLDRFCTLNGYFIIGGAIKLFEFFKNNFIPNTIIGYSDLRYSNGQYYKDMGFVFQSNTS